MLNSLTKKTALYCCASTFAMSSSPEGKHFSTPPWLETRYARTQEIIQSPEFYKTSTDALASTGLVLCGNPLINASTTGTLRAHPRVLWSGSLTMAATVIPSATITSFFKYAFPALAGKELTGIENCLASGIGGALGAGTIHRLDTLATWQHTNKNISWRNMRECSRKAKFFWHPGMGFLMLREGVYSTGWAGLSPIVSSYFTTYLPEKYAQLASGIMTGAAMGIATTPLHNLKLEAQLRALAGKDTPGNFAIYQHLRTNRTLWNNLGFRVVLNIFAVTWMSAIPGWITTPRWNR